MFPHTATGIDTVQISLILLLINQTDHGIVVVVHQKPERISVR